MAAAGDIAENIIINAGAGDAPEIQNDTGNPQPVELCEPNEDCPICLDNFEEEKLDIVTCGCGYMVCRKCTQNYLLHTTQDPHCIKCKRAWDKEFQFEALTPTFVNNKYRKHRQNLLFEREKARLPDAQPYVEQYKNKSIFDQQLAELNKQLVEQRAVLQTIMIKRDAVWRNIETIKSGKFVKPKEKRQFIRKCPTDDCRGFLSSAYKCDLCKVFVCSKCLEPKGFTKDEEHTCIQSNVESANAIKKETRPCPRCAVPIYKISGCDQMWCTQCQVAFSWRTGQVDTGRVHNPHFYQFMQNNEGVIRNPGEQVCGGLPSYYNISQTLRKYQFGMAHTLYDTTMKIYRGIVHMQRVIIHNLRQKLNQAQDNLDLRVKYLAKDVDEKYVKRYILQRDNLRSKNTAMLHVMELYNVVLTEQLNAVFTPERYNIRYPEMTKKNVREKFEADQEKFRDELEKMFEVVENTRAYCNSEFEKISRNHKMKVYIITEDFTEDSHMHRFK